MKISAKTRYGVRLMLELALNHGKGLLFLKEIAKRQEISEKYLSQIIIPLKAKGLIASGRGAYGGYMLTKNPSEITLKDIIETLEGDITLVGCAANPAICKRAPLCASRDVWVMLADKISEAFSSIDLEDLVKMHKAKEEKVAIYNI